MPIYMDVHQVPGAEALDLAEAHRKDMLIQSQYQCKCMTYWLDEPRGVAFCLIEAPDKTAVEGMHKNSHGFIPHKIIEVKSEVVASFLGRIQDPEEVEISDSGLKVFSESAFRILLVTDITDPVLLKYGLGPDRANDLLQKINGSIRISISNNGGSEVEYAGHGFIASFSSAVKAINCAFEIQKNLSIIERKRVGLKISLTGGEPISKSDKLFGDAIQLATYLCAIVNHNQVIVSSVVKALLARDYFHKSHKNLKSLSVQEESMVESLYKKLEKHWQNPDFAITDFGQSMSMSKSQLYRTTINLWGMSPNVLLKEFRLNKALVLMNRKSLNISQITFDTGFNSPSYFTKCFKRKFGLLPAIYLSSLQ